MDVDQFSLGTQIAGRYQIIEELGAGEVMEGTIDIYKEKLEPHTLKVDSNWINKFLGIEISKEDMKLY